MKIKTEFFNKLNAELEKHFEKGECCKNCNAKLPCRSKALVLMAYANVSGGVIKKL